jgi:ABC-type phosphate transport system auxiliary subunit
MSNVYDFEHYKKLKEAKELKDNAQELLDLLDSFMVDGESFMITVEDEDGNKQEIDLNEFMDSLDYPDYPTNDN